MSRLYSETEELYTEEERAEDLKYMEQALINMGLILY